MAELTLSVGPITATKTADDAKAAEILTLFAQSIGVEDEASNQEKAQAIVNRLAAYITQHARRQYEANNPATTIDWSA